MPKRPHSTKLLNHAATHLRGDLGQGPARQSRGSIPNDRRACKKGKWAQEMVSSDVRLIGMGFRNSKLGPG